MDPTQAPNFETKDAVGGLSAEVKDADDVVVEHDDDQEGEQR